MEKTKILLRKNRYPKNVIDNQIKTFLEKQSATDALKTTSKRLIRKTAEANSDLIGNKIAYIITKVLKT